MIPTIISGNIYTDSRGILLYNNDFDASAVKRMYIVENNDLDILRGWQGHKVEQRWFSAVQGVFCIKLIKIDDWIKPSKNLFVIEYELDSSNLNVLHIPAGYVTCIKSKVLHSKLLVLADYLINELKDEYKYPSNYFNNIKK